jgi:hypothetical protein
MLYVGLDVHEKYTTIQAMDKAGFLAMSGDQTTDRNELSGQSGSLTG